MTEVKANPHNLSDSELELLETLDTSSSIVFLSSKDSHAKYDFLKAFLLEQTEKGKTLVFRAREKKPVIEYLRKIGLSDFVLDLRKDTQITRDQIGHFSNKDRNYQIESIKANFLYKKSLSRLEEVREKYNEEIFGTYPRLKVAELFYLSKKRGSTFKLDLDVSSRNYRYDQKEFWQLRKKIEKAAKYYRSSFSFLRTSDVFAKDIYRDFHLAANQEIVFKYLQKFIADAEDLCKGYRTVFEQIREQLLGDYKAHVRRLKKLNEDLEIQTEFYKIVSELSPSKKAFSKNEALENQKIKLRSVFSVIQTELESTQLFKLNLPENSWIPNVSELSTFSIDLKKLIASNHLIIQSKVDEQLEILNSNNFDAPELAHLVRAQSDLIYAINGAKLFKEEIHNLSISAWKNYDFLQALTKKLLQSRLFLEVNSDYCIYRSFEFTMEAKILDLVSALESVRNSDWIERFETWYFEALFNKFTISELEQIWNQFDAFSEVKLANSSFQKYRAAAVFQNAQERTGDMTKRVRKDGSDWKSLLLAAKDEFKTHFPIVLCDEEFFSSEVANLPYDYLICIDNHDIPQNIFANSHFNSILCLHSSPISTEVRNSASDSKNYKSKKYIRLKPHRISANSGQLDHLPGKISFAKSLTHILSLSAYEKHFYSARDFSIITCLSPFCAKLLELELQEIRIKSLRYTHLESGIVEDVILKEDSNKYFVIQDGFLDPMLDLEWQVSTLRNIGLAGMKILTIDTQSLAKNNHLGILDLIDIPETKKMAAYSASK